MRKQVERSGRNARMLVTTYEGNHSHDPPATSSGVRAGGRRGGILARRPSDGEPYYTRLGCLEMPALVVCLPPSGIWQLVDYASFPLPDGAFLSPVRLTSPCVQHLAPMTSCSCCAAPAA